MSTAPRDNSTLRMVERLRARSSIADARFDVLLSPLSRQASGMYWTPVDVAQRVAAWVDDYGVRRVVDVGSGVGKFCVIAALASRRCRFIGVEQRGSLVEEARALAARLGVADRVEFVHGTFEQIRPASVDAYYFFNPFGENLIGRAMHIDERVELSSRRFQRDVAAACRLLSDAPEGTFLFKYNGFGAHVPRSYDLLQVDRALPCVLRAWRKKSGTVALS